MVVLNVLGGCVMEKRERGVERDKVERDRLELANNQPARLSRRRLYCL